MDEKPEKKADEPTPETILSLRDVSIFYDDFEAVKSANMEIYRNRVTAFIGPSGCGKTTLLRTLNRMNDEIVSCRSTGRIDWDGTNTISREVDPVALRKRIGMVFQKPNPFPKSIRNNISFGPAIHGLNGREAMDKLVERCLRDAALWEEVADRLDDSAMSLSGGQQQRLCIARALSVEPEIILMDEPTSALDPIATTKIENLIRTLREKYTVIIVTHNMQQAARISDYTGFMYIGELVEFGETTQIFENPREALTDNYLTGRFG